MDNNHLPLFLKLAGKQILIGDEKLKLGIPKVYMLKPHKTLYSRLVTIKGFLQPNEFKSALIQKLESIGIKQEPILFHKDSSDYPIRKTIRIKDKEIIGYPVLIPNLDPNDSILLQEVGLGGRRKMGCGHFVGVR
ncbi:MAG: type I-MYXAN CRISPR-associated protein Cas6/Cmx6 [Leptospiraceae bacterium]|nr:type I-MYXAN CRISPR-associated protein Cas6/Cmx6 [Leptospiraceae bacterium]MCK6382143.1 type I-MYXAN CRISPR-associated protein Cas6/Cmx6 [Leptospiraceae bacterium]